MPASNTRECFRDVIGKTVVGVLFDALPVNRPDLARGNKTLVFDDGSGLTLSNKGSYWRERKADVDRAIHLTRQRLDDIRRETEGVLSLAESMSLGDR